MHLKIKDIEHLKRIAKGRNQLDCFILLSIARSSKTFLNITDSSFTVINEIDGTEQQFKNWNELNDPELTNIGKAIKYGNFYVYEYEMGKNA